MTRRAGFTWPNLLDGHDRLEDEPLGDGLDEGLLLHLGAGAEGRIN